MARIAITIPLAETADLAAADALKTQLQTLPIAVNQVALDATQTVSIGTPMVQTLLVAQRLFREQDRLLLLIEPTDAVKAAFADLGLSSQLLSLEPVE